jgi:hypothetical protein
MVRSVAQRTGRTRCDQCHTAGFSSYGMAFFSIAISYGSFSCALVCTLLPVYHLSDRSASIRSTFVYGGGEFGDGGGEGDAGGDSGGDTGRGGTAMRERTEDVSRARVICGALSQRLSVDTHMAVGVATRWEGEARRAGAAASAAARAGQEGSGVSAAPAAAGAAEAAMVAPAAGRGSAAAVGSSSRPRRTRDPSGSPCRPCRRRPRLR